MSSAVAATCCAAIAALLAPANAAAQAQQDFSFAGINVNQSSIAGVAGCHNNVGITVTTTDFSNGNPVSHNLLGGTSLQMPWNANNDPVNQILVVISFSSPVQNPRLAVQDIDYEAQYITGTEPHEFLSNLTPGYSITPYGSFVTPVNVPAGTVTPLDGVAPDNRDAACWLEWTGCHDELRFVYNRSTTQLTIWLDSLEFDCECAPCGNCTCPTRVNVLTAETTPNEFGQLSAHLEILSGGNPISQVNISLPWYDMVAPAECIDCHANDITMNGHIYTALPLQGVDPTFVGPPGVGQSAEVSYCFVGSMPVNDNVPLKLQFPAVLELECCKPDVEYCLKVEVIDKDCRYCEFLFCFPTDGMGGGGGKSLAPPAAPPANRPTKAALLVFPNPTTGRMQATVPLSHATRAYTVHDQSGKQVLTGTANGTQLDLDVSGLGNGQYVLGLGSGDDRLEASFVVQR